MYDESHTVAVTELTILRLASCISTRERVLFWIATYTYLNVHGLGFLKGAWYPILIEYHILWAPLKNLACKDFFCLPLLLSLNIFKTRNVEGNLVGIPISLFVEGEKVVCRVFSLITCLQM